MEFSLENLKILLFRSKGLALLPGKQRQIYMDAVLKSSELQQYGVFETLTKAEEQDNLAEIKYNKKIKNALDEFITESQSLQKTTLINLAKEKEKKTRSKEMLEMDKMLNELNKT